MQQWRGAQTVPQVEEALVALVALVAAPAALVDLVAPPAALVDLAGAQGLCRRRLPAILVVVAAVVAVVAVVAEGAVGTGAGVWEADPLQAAVGEQMRTWRASCDVLRSFAQGSGAASART